jgi:FkbM family methyltransferase
MTFNDILCFIEKIYSRYEKLESMIHKGISLYGAGLFGQTSLKYLRDNGYHILHFIDSSSAKQGNVISGLNVVSPEYQLNTGVILITSLHAVKDIENSFKTNLPILFFYTWFVVKNIDKYKWLYELFADSRSKEVLVSLLMSMLTGEEKYCANVYEDNQYFSLPQFRSFAEHFVNIGAFVGDTVEHYLWSRPGGAIKSIYAFEPSKKAYKCLKSRCNRLIKEWGLDKRKVHVVNKGIAANCEKYIVESDSILGQDHYTPPPHNEKLFLFNKCHGFNFTTIDTYFMDKEITLLAADIEGMEMSLLEGAKNSIAKYRPKLALSVYHGANDIFEIIKFVTNIVPEYRYAIRNHTCFLGDTVLYCFID